MIDISKMYFATINAPMAYVPEDIYGLQVANSQFMNALLTNGSFAGYHFFVSDSLVKKTLAAVKKTFKELPNIRKVRIFPFSKIRENFQQFQYMVFHHSDPFNSNYYFVRQELGLQNYPISCFVHTVSGHWVPSSLLQNAIMTTKPYDVMFCPTRSLSTAVQNIFQRIKQVTGLEYSFQGELVNIPFGVDTTVFKPRPKAAIRKKLKLPGHALIIGYIGRVTAWNKMDLLPLLQVFKQLRDQTSRKDIYLYIIGREQQKDYIKLLKTEASRLRIDKYVRFVTKHKNKQIPLYYSALDIFVSPCDHVQETFGITPVEAMASGVPAVVSDWDGYKETVVEGETGFKIPTYWHSCAGEVHDTAFLEGLQKTYMQLGQTVAIDIPKFVLGLKKLVEDTALRAKMSTNARIYAVENFSWKKIIERYEAVWKDKYLLAQQDKEKYKRDSFYSVPYFDLFQHYASGILGLDTVVQTTSSGNDLARSNKNIRIHHELKGKIFNDEVKQLASLAAQPMAFSELLNRMQNSFSGLAENEFMTHALWMLKHGFLQIK
jgi:D-inositol-3-phosphate glycosyltransferase